MTSYEDILLKLEEYDRTNPIQIPKELEEFVGKVANTGETVFPWNKIKLVYRKILTSAITKYVEEFPVSDIPDFSFETMKSNILDKFDSFEKAPFTIQRFSELLINHLRFYKRIDKFMRAVQKILFVTSFVEPCWPKRVIQNGFKESTDRGKMEFVKRSDIEKGLIKSVDDELELVSSIMVPSPLPRGDPVCGRMDGGPEFLIEADIAEEAQKTPEACSQFANDEVVEKSGAINPSIDTAALIVDPTKVNDVTVDIFISDIKDPDFVTEVIVDQCLDGGMAVDDRIDGFEEIKLTDVDPVSSVEEKLRFPPTGKVSDDDCVVSNVSSEIGASEGREVIDGGLFVPTKDASERLSVDSESFDGMKADVGLEELPAVGVDVNLRETNDKQVPGEDIGDHICRDGCLPRAIPLIKTYAKPGQ